MYRCQITGKLSRQGDPRTGDYFVVGETQKDESLHAPEKLRRIVVETREKTYKHWDKEAEEEWFSRGTEIVHEINVTEEGQRIWESWTSEQQAAFVKTKFHPSN